MKKEAVKKLLLIIAGAIIASSISTIIYFYFISDCNWVLYGIILFLFNLISMYFVIVIINKSVAKSKKNLPDKNIFLS